MLGHSVLKAGAAGSAGDLDLGEERMATASGGEQLEGSNYFRRWGKSVGATGGETMVEIRSQAWFGPQKKWNYPIRQPDGDANGRLGCKGLVFRERLKARGRNSCVVSSEKAHKVSRQRSGPRTLP